MTHRGFTLIEVLLYIGIFSILLLALFTLFDVISDSSARTQAQARLAETSTFIYLRLSDELFRATQFSIQPGELHIWNEEHDSSWFLSEHTLMETHDSYTMPLNDSSISITKLIFTNTGTSTLRVEIGMSTHVGSGSIKTETSWDLYSI
jgi:prepilin-type N-terminal cleavage/methylation domain-containing protein